MKNKVVIVPTIKEPIQKSPGFQKKALADFKLDLLALCGFGCRYCSSNNGNVLRINRQDYADMTEQQLGERLLPADAPELTFEWTEIMENLEEQLASKKKTWGEGQTLVMSMQTDAFSPRLVKQGITKRAMQLVLKHTSFRIRVLSKNGIVGTPAWIEFFQQHPGRFVVGLSIGTLNDAWARRIEFMTSVPSKRILAHHNLQDAGIPTFAMLCPVFPSCIASGQLDELIDAVRPNCVEEFWGEPYNDRQNWRKLHACLLSTDFDHRWLTEVYREKNRALWSGYATDLYVRLKTKAEREGWLNKLHYLLYESGITAADAPSFAGLEGVMLQAKRGADGLSPNPFMAALQT